MTLFAPAGVSLRRYSFALVLAGVAAASAPAAHAQTRAPATGPAAAAAPTSPFYLSLTGRPTGPAAPEGRKDLTGESDPGFYLGGVVGYAITGNLRAEIEAFYRQDGIGSLQGSVRPLDMTFTPSRPIAGSSAAYGGMARGLWEFGSGSAFAPYVGGGVGLANVEYDITVDSTKEQDETSLFAYEFTAGARYTITPRSSVRAGYRMFGTSEPDFSPARPGERTHAIEFGINYRF